jgi:hypothetical protein
MYMYIIHIVSITPYLYLQGALSILEMVEFYHSAYKLNLAYNNKIRLRGWQALSRTMKRVSYSTREREVYV